jgi:SAM-dependent methyltransferase
MDGGGLQLPTGQVPEGWISAESVPKRQALVLRLPGGAIDPAIRRRRLCTIRLRLRPSASRRPDHCRTDPPGPRARPDGAQRGGTGSYKPAASTVVAVEPSESMIVQRAAHLSPAIRAVADALPLADDAVDASMATLTVHQWPDPVAGLLEMRRVTAGPIVILTFDPEALDRLWLADYAPDLVAIEARRYPPIAALVEVLGGDATVHPVAIPFDYPDGFTEAFYGRPEAFLDPSVRRSQSAWSFLDHGAEQRVVEALAGDLASGRWDDRHGHLRTQPRLDGAVRLVVSG